MAWVSNHALPEYWSELNAARKQRQLCAQDIDDIKRECLSECGKKHIDECPKCYGKALDRMLARYNNEADREWFSQRRAFVLELDEQFSQAKGKKLSLKDIEANIESEKEAWYRWVLRRHPEFLAVTDCGVEQDELRELLDDPDRSKDELVKMVWKAVGKPQDWSPHVDDFADKVAAAGQDHVALTKLYVDEFLKDHETGEPVKGAETYIETYLAHPDMRIEQIIDNIISADKDGQSSQVQRDSHQGRLDELRRAKTAFELNKVQSKSQQQNASNVIAGEQLYSLPAYSVCEKEVDIKDVLSCSICQAVCQMGGDSNLTTYCSETCFYNGHEKHVESRHDCAAGDNCVRQGAEDEEMDDGTNAAVACTRCLETNKISQMCSSACAAQNLPFHLQEAHGFKGVAVAEVHRLVKPVEQVVEETLKKQNPGLQFAWLG